MSSTHVHVTARGEGGRLKALISPSQLLLSRQRGHRGRKIATLYVRVVLPLLRIPKGILSLPLFAAEGHLWRKSWSMEIWFSVGPKGAEDFVAEGEEGIEFEEFWGRNEIKRPLSLVIRRWKGRPGNRDFENEKCKLNLWVWWVVRIGRRDGTNRF